MLPEEIKRSLSLTTNQLKRNISPKDIHIESTDESLESTGLVGQARAEKVMRFGLNVNQKGYNIYVAGNSGVGKSSFTEAILAEFAEKEAQLNDWVYVYNFNDSYQPKMLRLPVGMGKKLQSAMEELITNLKEAIPKAFNEDAYQKERVRIINAYQKQIGNVIDKVNEVANKYNFTIQNSQRGFLTVPMIDGKQITEKEYQTLDQATLKKFDEQSAKLQEEIYDDMKYIGQLEAELKQTLAKLDERVADATTDFYINELQEIFKDCPEVVNYLLDVKRDVLKNITQFFKQKNEQNKNPFAQLQQQNAFEIKYKINLLVDHSNTKGAPIVKADNPSYYNLIGKTEYQSVMGGMSTDFTKIKPGYLHEANGGYLIIQAKDIFTKSYAWESLKRALLNEKIHIENIGEHSGLATTVSLKPDAIPLDVKVIVIGDVRTFQILYNYEEDFRKLFKIKVDFDVEMDFNSQNVDQMVKFIHRHCKRHDLLTFDETAISEVVEYSVRLVADQNKLSTQFNLLVEILYEADAWARLMDDTIVTDKHIHKAIDERAYRSNLYEEKVQENIENESILIDTDSEVVGQINALSVHQLGQYSFGRPSRITATTFIGQKGVISIERESKLSGNIHNKGVYILSGYLGQTFAQKHRLSLTANIAFEQSYGGVDGDSASAAELYTIISSLAEVPLKQGLAVTGSVNQKGMIQPIGGVNEKIEGFFDICKQAGLTGNQGVLIPKQNVKNLMLKDEVIEAIENNEFHIYQVSTIEEGLAILTDTPVKQLNEYNQYESGTIYHLVSKKLKQFADWSNPGKR